MKKVKQSINNFIRNSDNYCLYVYIMAFGLFITPYLLRQQIINPFTPRTFFWGINYISLSALFLFVLQTVLNKRINIWYLFPLFSVIALLPTQFAFPISWGVLFLFSCCCIFPQYILYSEFSTPSKDNCIRYFLIVFDCIIFILFITSLIDKFADRIVIKQLADFLSCDEGVAGFAYLEDSEHTRFFSILGHPLTNAFIFNFCYVLNILYNKYHKILLPDYVWTVIILLSLICCGGKTGITVGAAITVLIYFKKWPFYIITAVSIPVAYISGLLDKLIYRFTKLPLTTRRADGFQILLENEQVSFSFFRGYGSRMDEFTGSPFWFVNASTEFPFIGHALQYGFLFAFLLLLPPFIYVTHRLWKEKRFMDWFFWCLLYAEVNTYNGLSSCLDVSFIFYFLTFIILNITPPSDD